MPETSDLTLKPSMGTPSLMQPRHKDDLSDSVSSAPSAPGGKAKHELQQLVFEKTMRRQGCMGNGGLQSGRR